MLPMSYTREWAWEHTWAVFSIFGMILLNWLIFVILFPKPLAIYASVPATDLATLFLFGVGWGVGAVLFGLGMDLLGLAIGYPLIMGLSAFTGALVPLFFSVHGVMSSLRSTLVCSGTTIAIAGIAVCSIAGARRKPSARWGTGDFYFGLLIAIAAGLLCCLPNIGMSFGRSTLEAAKNVGASESTAGDAVWCTFFTAGGLVNLGYCGSRMLRNGSFKALVGPRSSRNWSLGAGMALLWIGSFYLYGLGASELGAWGPVIGWPVLISVSIGVGVFWGLRNGEWANAPSSATRLLSGGLFLVLIAVLTLAISNTI